ncbi:MAG: ATP-binding protein [Patescibacteria group bacterium]|nr:ATP-binding protein [Patescibacteria group bacterium]
MYIQRQIKDDILKYLNSPEIIAIVGPRQSGKTTVIKRIYQNLSDAIFLTFEDQQTLSLFEKNIKEFIQTYVVGKKYVFIDEFQYAQHGGKLLKYIYDTNHTKIIISGSSAIDLTIKAIKFLVGRVFVLNMFPLNFSEYLFYRDKNFYKIYNNKKISLKNLNNSFLAPEQKDILKKYYEEYAIWGGYPRVVLAQTKEEKIEILKNIYNTYFLREVKGILGIIDDYKLNRLIKALALQIGNMIEYRELAQISEMSVPTIKKYLNFLSKTYISELINPFYKNKRKEIVKNQKIYFYDTGLRNSIINDFRFFDERTDFGALLENTFWMQLIKNGHIAQYWRDKNKNEIDFIIDIGEGKIRALEIKYRIDKYKGLPLSFTKEHKEILGICGYLKDEKSKELKDRIFLPLF